MISYSNFLFHSNVCMQSKFNLMKQQGEGGGAGSQGLYFPLYFDLLFSSIKFLKYNSSVFFWVKVSNPRAHYFIALQWTMVYTVT